MPRLQGFAINGSIRLLGFPEVDTLTVRVRFVDVLLFNDAGVRVNRLLVGAARRLRVGIVHDHTTKQTIHLDMGDVVVCILTFVRRIADCFSLKVRILLWPFRLFCARHRLRVHLANFVVFAHCTFDIDLVAED